MRSASRDHLQPAPDRQIIPAFPLALIRVEAIRLTINDKGAASAGGVGADEDGQLKHPHWIDDFNGGT